MDQDQITISEMMLPTHAWTGINKKQIEGIIKGVIHSISEEGADPLRIAEGLAVMEKFVDGLRKSEEYLSLTRDELAKHGGKYTAASGAIIEMTEAGVTYDYSSDSIWRDIDTEIKDLTKLKKQREEELKSIAPGRMVADPETGEVMEGALKKSKSTYKITLAK